MSSPKANVHHVMETLYQVALRGYNKVRGESVFSKGWATHGEENTRLHLCKGARALVCDMHSCRGGADATRASRHVIRVDATAAIAEAGGVRGGDFGGGDAEDASAP